MSVDVRCPRCGHPARQVPECRHLRWRPQRGGPIEFAKSVVRDRTAPGTAAANMPNDWWESQFDWLLERITARIDVVDGYCFADPGELDLLRLDIKHRLAPEPGREQPRTMP